MAGVEAGGVTYFALGNQTPAEQGDEQYAGQCHGDTDRAEIEHGEGTAAMLGAKTGDDQVRRCTDQRGHAAEDGAEGQWHQHAPRRQLQACRNLQGDRHQQGEGADVVHECREQRAQAGQCGDGKQHASAAGQQSLGQSTDRPSALQTMAEHQHAGDGDHRRVTETCKGFALGHQANDHARQQRAQRYHVMTPAAPDEQAHAGNENDENQALFESHEAASSL